jgi:putative nucleotidyltransferase with HDIG domain
MWHTALRFLQPPPSDDYLHAQRSRLLHQMLVWVFLAAAAIGLVNLAMGWLREAAILAALAMVCLVGILLSGRRKYARAAFLLCLTIFASITLAAFLGAGINDAAVVAYPVFILCATFLFGNRRGLTVATLASVAAVLGLWQLQRIGWVVTDTPATLSRVAVLTAIYLGMAGVTQVVRRTWDDNLIGLIDSYDKTLQGWALALEYRDGETAGHCERVVGLSVRLAKSLGCTPEQVEAIKRGAYLHDIGKMAIPDDILKKPGPLTAEERETIERHPELGRGLIREIPFLAPAIEITYAHHERWDGSGYPAGLKGDEIPLSARIFCVVDQWDALISDRPYRDAWPRAEAITYVVENTGTIFDPRIAEAFLHLVEEPR